jgi:hypothetical protein
MHDVQNDLCKLYGTTLMRMMRDDRKWVDSYKGAYGCHVSLRAGTLDAFQIDIQEGAHCPVRDAAASFALVARFVQADARPPAWGSAMAEVPAPIGMTGLSLAHAAHLLAVSGGGAGGGGAAASGAAAAGGGARLAAAS